MRAKTDQRFQSGEVCIVSGWYDFDGYVDGSSEPYPSLFELEIPLHAGEVFPPIRNPRRACYWTMVDGLAPQELGGP